MMITSLMKDSILQELHATKSFSISEVLAKVLAEVLAEVLADVLAEVLAEVLAVFVAVLVSSQILISKKSLMCFDCQYFI